MPLPPLDTRGLLPDGLHDAQLEEIPSQFCHTAYRTQMWSGFLQFISEIRTRVAGGQLILGGSFFSDKPTPDDIEATIITGTDATIIGSAMLVFFDHDRIKRDYGVDYYATLPAANNFADFFRYVGPKTAFEKQLNLKDRRGIVRVIKWVNG